MQVRTPASPLRVLVVDDSVDMCTTTARLVELWGHDARIAGDGPAALARAAEYRPDVVLLDLGLPGMDGCEVARRLRIQMAPSQPLVVSLSGYTGAEYSRRALEAGCTLHWIKPAEPEELRLLLDAQKRARDSNATTEWTANNPASDTLLAATFPER